MKENSTHAPSTRRRCSRLWIAAFLCVAAGVVLLPTVVMTGVGIGLVAFGLLLGFIGWIQRQNNLRDDELNRGTPSPRIIP